MGREPRGAGDDPGAREKVTEPDRYRALERLAGRLASRLAGWLKGRSEVPENLLFTVLLFTAGEGGFAAYSSNARRGDMIRALREMADRLQGEDGRAQLGTASAVIAAAARTMDRKLIDRKLPESDAGWNVSIRSFKAGLDRFEKTGERLMSLEAEAMQGSEQDEIDESWRDLIALWTTSMVQMSASLTLALSYAPIDPRSIPTEIRGTDEIH